MLFYLDSSTLVRIDQDYTIEIYQKLVCIKAPHK